LDTVLDDMAVPMAIVRQGYRVVFETGAIAFEHGSRSAWEEFSRKTRIVAGAVQFLRRGRTQIPWSAPQAVFSLFSHKILRWLSPVAGAVFIMSCFALRNDGLMFAVIWWSAVVALAVGALGCSESLRRLLPIGICYYFCMVHLAAATGLFRGIIGGQAVAWERFPRTPVSPA
jgi:cellulose synthase/poly-beta-1,6-N-acetylglucosamine synthase-like glycosyltransferase